MSVANWLRRWSTRSATGRPLRRLTVELLEDRCVLAAPTSPTSGPPVVSVQPIAPLEGAAFNGTVATFTNTGDNDPATDYSAVINWGDGSNQQIVTPTGPINGVFTVTGSHTYVEEGSYSVTVAATDNLSPITGTGSATITVSDQAPVVSVQTIAAKATVPFSGEVATFVDPAGNEPTANYSATINWGDGTGTDTTTPTVGMLNGVLIVNGSHTYLTGGTDSITVTVLDEGGASGTNTNASVIGFLPPTSAITFPSNGANFTSSTWTGTVSGTAQGSGGSTIGSVRVTIVDTTSGQDWNGTAFVTSATPIILIGLGTTAWSLPLPASELTNANSYTVSTQALDTAGDLQVTPTTATFSFTGTSPPPASPLPASPPPASPPPASPPPPAQTEFPPDRVAVFHGDGSWTLDLGGNGTDPVTFAFGAAGDQGVIGDWNGAGYDEIGTVRVQADGTLLWSLDYNGNDQWDNGPGGSGGDMSFVFGKKGDEIVVGDWNGDGKTKVGVVRADANGVLDWSLDMNDNPNNIDPNNYVVYHFGLTGDKVVTGDWTGNGIDKIGVARPDLTATLANGSHPMQWSLDYAGTGVYVGNTFTFGTSFDTLMVGDWNGDGVSKIGVARPDANGISADVSLDFSETATSNPLTQNFTYGQPLDLIFRGDWNGNGKDEIGVARVGTTTTLSFTLDSNADYQFDAGDAVFSMPGLNADAVFIGRWKPQMSSQVNIGG